jgi:hypothetical protein
MRAALLLPTFATFALTACSGNGSNTGNSCTEDSECGKDVCANDQMCEPASDVELVHVTWTISGSAASATTCASLPALSLEFSDGDPYDTFWFLPVPCAEGEFTATKLPTNYDAVAMQDDQMQQTFGTAEIGDGAAMMDLTPAGATGAARP